jgi:hypothetical protein
MKTRLLAALAATTLCAPGFTQSATRAHDEGDVLLEWIDGALDELLWEHVELGDLTVVCELPGGLLCEVSPSRRVNAGPPMEMYVPGVGYLVPLQQPSFRNGGAALFDPRSYDALDLELQHHTLGLVGIGQFFAERGDGALFPVWTGRVGSTTNVNLSTTSMTADGRLSVRVDEVHGYEEALRWRQRNSRLYASGGQVVGLQGLGWGSRIVPLVPTGESIMQAIASGAQPAEQCYDYFFYDEEGELLGCEKCVEVGEEVDLPEGTSYFRFYCKKKAKPAQGGVTTVPQRTPAPSATSASQICVEITVTFYDCNEGGSEEQHVSTHCVCSMEDLQNLQELISILPAWGACFIETSVTGRCDR